MICQIIVSSGKQLNFSNKGLNSNKLLLKEKGNLVSDEK